MSANITVHPTKDPFGGVEIHLKTRGPDLEFALAIVLYPSHPVCFVSFFSINLFNSLSLAITIRLLPLCCTSRQTQESPCPSPTTCYRTIRPPYPRPALLIRPTRPTHLQRPPLQTHTLDPTSCPSSVKSKALTLLASAWKSCYLFLVKTHLVNLYLNLHLNLEHVLAPLPHFPPKWKTSFLT